MRRFLFIVAAVLVTLTLVVGIAAAQEPSRFVGGWPYQLPPDGHFNTYASGRIDMGIYQDLMEPPLAVYLWASGEYEPMLAESFGFEGDTGYTVTLKSGLTWSDGSPVSAQDIVSTFYTGYLVGWAVWNDIASVEAVDDLTASFTFKSASLLGERRILVENMRPASVYGTFAERAMPLVEAGAAAGSADFDALLAELTAFRPEMFVASGPYQLLTENITDAKVVLVANAGGLNSDIVAFDEVHLWNGETEAATPLVLNNELWYGTYGFPPASEAEFVSQGIDIVRGPSYSGPALYFNHALAPFDDVRFRQALAYAINREQNGFVSLGESGVAVECMCGLSDNLVPLWLSDDIQDQLNVYDQDMEMAEALMTEAGFSRNADGLWVGADGAPLAFELIFPAEFLDWAAAAENVTQQLNDFGLTITARGVQFQQQQQDVYDNNFQLAIRNWGVGSPFPGQSYLQPYDRYNGQGELAGEEVGGGMRFPLAVEYSGGTIDDLRQLALDSGIGLDTAVQTPMVEALALSFNELLPAIPLWERYGNNPLNRAFLGAPEADAPIWSNAGADHFMPYLILTGGIAPAM
jgi:peptide/nickel transport system substrate-binding protein